MNPSVHVQTYGRRHPVLAAFLLAAWYAILSAALGFAIGATIGFLIFYT